MQPPTTEQRLSLELLVSRSQADLAADTAAQEYLTQRGFTAATAAQWRLGVVTSPQVGAERYRGRLVIPYLTPAGVINARFRCLQAKPHDCKEYGHAKYLGMEGWDTNLFNVADLKRVADAICVCEGELDAITLSMCGIPAVAVPGASNWHKHFSRCLEDFTKVYVLGDGDTAGKGLNKQLIHEARAVPVRMPKGEDVNSLYLKEGPDGLRRLIAG